MIIVLFCSVGLVSNVLGIFIEVELKNNGQITQAMVTDASTHVRLIFASHRVEFKFTANNQTYWCDGSILRNVYAMPGTRTQDPGSYPETLPKADWDRAVRAKRLQVLFLPDNPWINRPAAAPQGILSPLATLIWGSVLWPSFIGAGLYLAIGESH